MRRPATLRLAVLAGVLASAGAAQAGSGLRSEDERLYSATLGYLSATDDWDHDGDVQPNNCRSEYSGFSHYGEYGFSYYYTGFAKLSLAQSRCGDESRTGLGDLKLGIRGRIDLYRNDRAWELEVTIPTNRDQDGGRRLGCGAFGLAGNVDFKDEWTENQFFEYGASAQLWEEPLAHQVKAHVGGSGHISRRWSWGLGVLGSGPLTEGEGDPEALLSDCGTEGRVVRVASDLRFRFTDFTSFHCGATLAVWGRDVSRSRGLSCGFTRLWK